MHMYHEATLSMNGENGDSKLHNFSPEKFVFSTQQSLYAL